MPYCFCKQCCSLFTDSCLSCCSLELKKYSRNLIELPLLFLMILVNSLKEGKRLFLGLVNGSDDSSKLMPTDLILVYL